MNQTQLTPSERNSAAFLTQFLQNQEKTYLPVRNVWQSSSTQPDTDAVLTLIAPALNLKLVEQILADCAPVLTGHAVTCHGLHARFGDGVVCVQVSVADMQAARAGLHEVAERYQVELALQVQQPSLSTPGLLVMDMDSTLIQMECIDEIARLGDVGDKVAAVTRQAMRGELDFKESLMTRVACLEGIAEAQLAQIRDAIPLMPGAALLVQMLKQYQWKVAVASGGFTYFADYLAQRLGLDAAFSNVLAVQDGMLTGKVTGEIVDAGKKAQTVIALSQKWQIDISQTIAMGDGANDLAMMDVAGLGVACHAKPAVVEQAEVAIRYGGLHTLLYLLQA
ncbi:phosphoserine phosphatase SerB [Alteromonas halophila]|uniref:Phosphoserine phosphatase n=1 Tax=Alteromonas halophila TaxID=516698 RepID=A0A918JKN0_9ALTE|nr:phosphoserine phosphatase SerB [Alteromonas halophila]GGW85935.1 hypothetical protein GCM10007391_19440 [Alteromonas halophila]